MRRVSLATVLMIWLVLAGCARSGKSSNQTSSASGAGADSTNATLIVTPEESLNGKVSWVNANLRFVVVTFPPGQMPAADRRLNVYRRGLKVAEVKISGPQTEDSIVADIETGEVETGDTVSDR